MKINKKILLGLTTILALGMFMGNVRAENIGDISSSIDGETGSGCEGKDSCWLYADGGINHPVYGIRISIVDGNGNLVSKKAMDYLATKTWVHKVNNNKSYFRYAGSNGEIVNRMTLLLNPSSASLRKHNGSAIAKIWPTSLGTLPYIYDDNFDVDDIERKILGLKEEQLVNFFFKDLEYSIPNSNILENHYMIIEPLTMVSAYNKTKIYYGTYYELTKELIGTYNYQNSDSNGKGWIASVLDMKLPLSMFITGNEKISGYENEAYFNGKLKIAKDKYTWYQKSKKRTRVTTTYVKNGSIGYGIGIIGMSELEIERPTCDLSKPEHFADDKSGPGGIDCCIYVRENIDDYGISKSELFDKYSRCSSMANANTCTVGPTSKNAVCGKSTIGSIVDTSNWECIYDSVYSNDTNWQSYFLKHEEDTCSVFCRDSITFNYPYTGISVLAGHHFLIGTNASSYSSYIDELTNITKVKPAILGPIQTVVTRECKITGTSTSRGCNDAVEEQLNSINSPTIKFSYDSDYYKNPSLTLNVASTTTNQDNSGMKKTLTTNYTLPDDSTTFRYVTTNGVSYRKVSEIGDQPYENIGPHLPIHFGVKKGPNDYTVTINSFNSNNFDTYIKNKKEIKESFEITIETYVNKLIEKLLAKNDLLKPVNGIYYFSDNFKKRLEEKYTVDNFLSMSCANTSNYTCDADTNGIYCVNKSSYTNTEDTYTNLFKNCINNKVIDISMKYNNTTYSYNMNYTCNFNINNLIIPPGDPDPGNPDVNVIFRPISLNNPFPGKDGSGREVGSNWGYGEDYTPNNNTIYSVITNNREVETDKIYRELDPLYKITLTPALIKQIREYNKNNDYDDFNLKCNAQGEKCTSTFIRETFASHFTGCGITNKSAGLTCNNNNSEKWNN